MSLEEPVISSLLMDRSMPLGNSEDVFLRRALHVKVANTANEAIPVYLETQENNSEIVTGFNKVTAIAANSETTILNYTVPALRAATLLRVESSGTNIGSHRVYLNGTLIAERQTYWADFNTDFVFAFDVDNGFKLQAGDLVTIKSEHYRQWVGDFSARILLTEYDA